MIAIILAGGTGTRLWPYSRSMTPKQFLNLGSSYESLLQETCKRIESLVSPEKIFVVGSKNHENELNKQMFQIFPQYKENQLLIEPASRNTAPAILWAIMKIKEKKSTEPVLVLASDHLIKNPKNFIEALKKGETLSNSGYIVTFGILPDKPETGYGYIKKGEETGTGFKVDKFVEKPDVDTARYYLESSRYFWNASIFMASTETWENQYRELVPDLYFLFEASKNKGEDFTNKKIINEIYESIKSESVDYALLEKSNKVALVPVEMEWSDLGSWESIFQVSEKNESGNVIRGNVIAHDTKNSLIFSSKKLVTSVGVENLIIVETDDALLVCDMKRSQDVKKLVETLKKEERHEYKFHTEIIRPWGIAKTIMENNFSRIRLLEIMPKKIISLQSHKLRSEHWVVLKGVADIKRGDESLILKENESTFIPKGFMHSLGNKSDDETLEIIEVQHGEIIDDEDIERY